MSESIGEMILPGTYIDVRAEGLIGVGGISTGNIGIVGSASKGPVGEVQILGSYSEALDVFGSYDRFAPTGSPLTLTRALEQVFKGGGSTVYAVRIASGSPGTMQWSVRGTGGPPPPELFKVSAASPGSWANSMKVSLQAGALTVELGRVKETFSSTTAGDLANEINAGSRLITAAAPAAADVAKTVDSVAVVSANAGTDGANVTTTEAKSG